MRLYDGQTDHLHHSASNEHCHLSRCKEGRQKRKHHHSQKKGFTNYLENNKCTNLVLSIPFSVTEPESNEMYLSRLFGSQKDTPAIVVLNSRGNLIADYLEKNHIEDVKMICMDLTSANIEALKKEELIPDSDQEPE